MVHLDIYNLRYRGYPAFLKEIVIKSYMRIEKCGANKPDLNVSI